MADTSHPDTTSPERQVTTVGAVIALCILGDSLMYNILPLEAQNLGIPLALVGLLLSANRLIRLFSNTWVGKIFERWGPRFPFIASTLLALGTTLLYGVGWGFAVFLLARIGWGIAWSALRQGGYQAVWVGNQAHKGRLMGILWGVIRLGSAASVLLGGYLRDRFGYQASIGVIAMATALSIPLALSIRWPQARAQEEDPPLLTLPVWRVAWQTAERRWLLLTAFFAIIFEGGLISSASLFLSERLGPETTIIRWSLGVATIAGMLLALRWISGLVIAPLIGALSDRLGQGRTMALLSCVIVASIAGVVLLPQGVLPLMLLAGVLLTSSGLVVTLNAAASGVATRSERPHLYVGAFSTAIDAGAALGPLLTYTLGNLSQFASVYVLTSGLMLLAVFGFLRAERTLAG